MSLSSETSENFSQDFRQLDLGGSNPSRSNALRQAQRLNRSVQPKDELSLEVMLFGIAKPELQPDAPASGLWPQVFSSSLLLLFVNQVLHAFFDQIHFCF
jgi:hypothetical protein